jgi:hypothetical protein
LSPTGTGSIKLYTPLWYDLGNNSKWPYNSSVRNGCTSTCFDTQYSGLESNLILINYENMQPNCISGSEIVIECKGYKNPIYQDVWSGFKVEVYDSERSEELIVTSNPTSLDATNYDPK